jgi:hypothetical protein
VIASIESQLGGRAEFDWRSEGLVCRLLVPLGENVPTSDVSQRQGHATKAHGGEQALRRA